MALDFHIAGPALVSVMHDQSSYVSFGRTDNQELVQFAIRDMVREAFRNDLGDAPAELIYQGARGVLVVPLVHWDEAVWATLLNRYRTGSSGASVEGAYTASTAIGARMITTGTTNRRTFGIKFTTTTTGEKTYTFPRCYFSEDGHRHFDIGNREKRLAFAAHVLADENGLFYTAATN